MDITVVQRHDLCAMLDAEAFWHRQERHPGEAMQPLVGGLLAVASIAVSTRLQGDGGAWRWVVGVFLLWGLYLLARYPARRLAMTVTLAWMFRRQPPGEDMVRLDDRGWRRFIDGVPVARADWSTLERAVVAPDRIGIRSAGVGHTHYLSLRRHAFASDGAWNDLVGVLQRQPIRAGGARHARH